MRKYQRFGDIVTLLNGRAYKQNELLNEGKYPVLRVGNFFSNRDWYYSDLELDGDKYCNDGDLLFAWSASFGPRIWDGGKAIFHYHIWKLVLSDAINKKYLYYYLLSVAERVKNEGHGITMIHTTKAEMENRIIPVPDKASQIEISSTLDKLQSIITHRKQQLLKLDELVKARFVEMFGDPVHNSLQLSVMPMTEVCEIIDGDRGKNYPKQEDFFEEEYCLFLNAKNVTKNGFDFTDCMFITKEKDEVLRKGKLVRGDVVLTTRGTLGNLAFYTDSVPFDNVRINSGMVILRMNKEVIDEVFFMVQFRMQVEDIKRSVASGSAQPQLPISTMNKINVIMPNLESQQAFSAFVSQTDKSKFSHIYKPFSFIFMM